MSGREMVIGIAAFAAGCNMLALRNFSPWIQLAFLVGGGFIIFLIIALTDDYDRKCRRQQHERQRISERNHRIKTFIEGLQIGGHVDFVKLKDTDGYTIHRKKYPGRNDGVVEEITYSFDDEFGYIAEFQTVDKTVTTITIGGSE